MGTQTEIYTEFVIYTGEFIIRDWDMIGGTDE